MITRLKNYLSGYSFTLVFILGTAFVIRLHNLNYNSLFLDEALYVMRGKRILDGYIGEGVGDISWVGGFPFFYPLISALLYEIGGLFASRALNVFLGTLAVFLTYLFTKELKFFSNERKNALAGLVAATFMATSAVPIGTSRIAIYDMLSFSLFFSGLVLLQRALRIQEARVYFISAVFVFLAFLAKYVVALYFPLLLIGAYYLTHKRDGKNSEILDEFIAPLIFMLFVYVSVNFARLRSFFFDYAISTKSPSFAILFNFWTPSWFVFILASIGAILLLKRKKRLTLILMTAASLPLIVHLMGSNSSSVTQHSFLSLFFLFPIIGAMFSMMKAKQETVGTYVVLSALILNYLFGSQHLRDAEGFWPNSDNAVKVFQENVSATDMILVEGSDIYTVPLYGTVPLENIVGPFVFSYKDQEGLPAYLKAIDDGYFQFIQLEGTYFPAEYLEPIEASLRDRYVNIFDDGRIRIFKLLQ